MPIDEWPTVAAADDALVADLLLGLKYSAATWTLMTTNPSLSGGLATFRWGRRKGRSRHQGVTMRFVADKKRATRSPTTPLSWSGGDGSEASSMMCCGSPPSRSKRVNVHSKRMNSSNGVEASTLQGMPPLFTQPDSRYDIQPRPQAFVLPDLNMLPSFDDESF